MTGTLVDLLALLGIIAIVCVAGWYVMGRMTIPEPFKTIVTIALVIIVAILAILAILRMTGHRLGGLEDGAPFRLAGEPGGAVTAVSGGTAVDM